MKAEHRSELDITVTWDLCDATGYNVIWGFAPDKLYHSHMEYADNYVNIGTMIKGQPVYLRIDAFNEKGISEGDVIQIL